jgi:hypothetical protein
VGHGLTINSGLVFFFSGEYGKWQGFGRRPARLHGFRRYSVGQAVTQRFRLGFLLLRRIWEVAGFWAEASEAPWIPALFRGSGRDPAIPAWFSSSPVNMGSGWVLGGGQRGSMDSGIILWVRS